MSIERTRCRRWGRGFTLIELIVFIVIVSVGLAGILSVLNITARHSADPMIRKNLLTIAEALLEEVTSRPFTWCDPDDSDNASTASSAADCTAGRAEGMGPEAAMAASGSMPAVAAETRGTFDNVNDYYVLGGLALATVTDVTGTHSYVGYGATINVTSEALNGIAAADSLRVTVTVTGGGDSLTVEGYRTRHSPNNMP